MRRFLIMVCAISFIVSCGNNSKSKEQQMYDDADKFIELYKKLTFTKPRGFMMEMFATPVASPEYDAFQKFEKAVNEKYLSQEDKTKFFLIRRERVDAIEDDGSDSVKYLKTIFGSN